MVKGSGYSVDGKEGLSLGALYSGEVLGALGVGCEDYGELLKSGDVGKGLGLCRSAGVLEAPLVWRALLDAAEGGNVSAIRLYFDIIGRDSGAAVKSADEEVAGLREAMFGGGE